MVARRPKGFVAGMLSTIVPPPTESKTASTPLPPVSSRATSVTSWLLAVVYRDVGAELLEDPLVVVTCCRENASTGRLGDLDGEGAHPTGATVDQYRLPNPHAVPPASGTAAASSCESEAGFFVTMSAFAT